MIETRISYLLKRLENEFWHVTPDTGNDGTVSIALTSIAHEAASILEAILAPEKGDRIWDKLAEGAIQRHPAYVRLSWGGVSRRIEVITSPNDEDNKWSIAGWEDNNAAKHSGALVSLGATLGLCGACYDAFLQKSAEAQRPLTHENMIYGIFESEQVLLAGGTHALRRANVRFAT